MAKLLVRTPQPFTATLHDRQIPDNLWERCPGCRALIYRRQLSDNALVCPHCAFHFQMTAGQWVALLFDPDSFCLPGLDSTLPGLPGSTATSTGASAQPLPGESVTKPDDQVLVGSGTIGGAPLECAISDLGFTGDGLGSRHGEQVACSAERALRRSVPLLTVNTSMGVRLDEGIIALMQMAKVSSVLARLARARQPHIAIIVDVCHSGVWASYVAGADVILAEPGATNLKAELSLPADAQTSETLLMQGLIDDIVPRTELRRTLIKLLRIYRG